MSSLNITPKDLNSLAQDVDLQIQALLDIIAKLEARIKALE